MSQVAIVTGSGQGLGKAYALALAKAGFNVVVNDVNKDSACKTASEVENLGQKSLVNTDDVRNGYSIVQAAVTHFGRIDVLVNNAGIIRDASFAKMTHEQIDAVLTTHLHGTFSCTHAAWPHMLKAGYGRIVNVSSAGGLYGNFGQANYASAKSGLIGFTKSLSQEGGRKGVMVNLVCPLAGTPMTEGLFPPELFKELTPESICGMVVYLASKNCDRNGKIYEAAGGAFAEVKLCRSEGAVLCTSPSADDISANLCKIEDFSNSSFPDNLQDSVTWAVGLMEGRQPASPPAGSLNLPSFASAMQSATLVDKLSKFLSTPEAATLVTKVPYCYRFDISSQTSKDVLTVYLDFKGRKGLLLEAPSEPDASFSMKDADFCSIVKGDINPQMAFLRGKMKIKGNFGIASKFTPNLFPDGLFA